MKMENQPFRRWAYYSLLNFWILSAVGVLLRYKIILPLPAVHQKNLLHAHSHFAFSGWVGMAIFTGMVWVIAQYRSVDIRKYNRLFWLGQVASFGMLFTFPFMGYKLPSICFSTLSVVFGYLLIIRGWRDLSGSGMPAAVSQWFRAAFLMLLISTFGTFCLAWLMTTRGVSQEWYIGSVYFFLHFQYNGWFLFAILGFFYFFLSKLPDLQGRQPEPMVFRFLFVASFPAYFLSALWMRLPDWMYWAAVVAALLQLLSLSFFTGFLFRNLGKLTKGLSRHEKWLWGFALLAFLLKIIMQALSTIPAISHYAFGYRPIVIGYLHMVLLGLVSFFLAGFFLQQRLLDQQHRLSRWGLSLFILSVVSNELLLMMQGAWSIRFESVPYANQLLFVVSVLISVSLLVLILGQRASRQRMPLSRSQ
jgi:hypothetical protein